jgi:hypothetical protein
MLTASSAGAPTRDELLRACAGIDREGPEVQVKACSAVIAGGQEDNDRLAAAFFNRGNAYVALRQLGHAIADYGQVIRLKPA